MRHEPRHLEFGARKRRYGVGFQATFLAASTVISQAITAVLYIVAARNTAPDTFGMMIAAIAVGTTAVGFLDFGTNSLWVRELSTGRITAETHGRRLAGKLLVAWAICGLWSIVCFLLLADTYYWIAGPIAVATISYQSFQVPLRQLARGDLVSFTIVGERVVALASFFLLSLAGLPAIDSLWIGLVLGSLIAAVLAWNWTPRYARPLLRPSLRTNPWASAGHFGIANLALSAQTLDTPIMATFGGAGAAGIYGAVARWTQPMGLLANAFSSASAPFMARAITGDEAWQHVRRSLWLPSLAIVACLGIAAFSSPIVDLLIGSQYEESAVVLQILAIGTVPAVMNQPLFMFAQARRLDRPVSLFVTITVVIQLSMVALFSTTSGAIGAALAAAISQVILFVSLVILLVVRRRSLFESGKIHVT